MLTTTINSAASGPRYGRRAGRRHDRHVDRGNQSRGVTTTYYWTYEYTQQGLGTYLGATPKQSLPPGSSWQQIQTPLSGLRPGTTYDSVTLMTSSSAGSDNATLQGGFTTTEHPRLRIVLSRGWFITGEPFPITVQASGTYDSLRSARIWVAKYPFKAWYAANADPVPTFTGNRVTLQPCNTISTYACPWLDRNFIIRAQLGPAFSATRFVYVLPKLLVTATRENNGYSPWVDVVASALVHQGSARYAHPLVYFYTAPPLQDTYRRVAVARLQVGVRSGIYGTQLRARARVHLTTAADFEACVRRRIVVDMGPRFIAHWCGRRVIR